MKLERGVIPKTRLTPIVKSRPKAADLPALGAQAGAVPAAVPSLSGLTFKTSFASIAI